MPHLNCFFPPWTVGTCQFTSKHGMMGHIATIHEGKKQLKCVICNSNFGHISNLKTHVVRVHEGKKEFKCAIYDKQFTSKHGMMGHIATIHDGITFSEVLKEGNN